MYLNIVDTMKNIINDIEIFLTNYQNVYGKNIYLNGTLLSPEKVISQIKRTSPPPIQINKTNKNVTLPQFNPELQKFYEEIHNCTKCSLSDTRINFVFGLGNSDADIMFVGEAPGKDEDEQGIPFVGRAGKLLNKMLLAIGLTRDEIFIANILKCRPPNNRDPLPQEVIQCEPHLKRQIEIISPKVIVALGRIAGQVLLKRKNETLRNLRQTVHKYDELPFIVTYHPAALLRNPNWKKEAWQDLKKIKEIAINQ